MKSKGSRFERDLIEKLWKEGFAAVRVAGSGTASNPTPDVVAGNGKRYIAIEVKMRRSLPLYLSQEEVEELKSFANTFGAEAYIALKLPRREWRFFPLDELERTGRTGKGYKVGEDAYAMGMEIREVLGKVIQRRLDN